MLFSSTPGTLQQPGLLLSANQEPEQIPKNNESMPTCWHMLQSKSKAIKTRTTITKETANISRYPKDTTPETDRRRGYQKSYIFLCSCLFSFLSLDIANVDISIEIRQKRAPRPRGYSIIPARP